MLNSGHWAMLGGQMHCNTLTFNCAFETAGEQASVQIPGILSQKVCSEAEKQGRLNNLQSLGQNEDVGVLV